MNSIQIPKWFQWSSSCHQNIFSSRMFGYKICNVIDSILISDPNFFLVTIMRTDLRKNKWTLDVLKKNYVKVIYVPLSYGILANLQPLNQHFSKCWLDWLLSFWIVQPKGTCFAFRTHTKALKKEEKNCNFNLEFKLDFTNKNTCKSRGSS